jgi:hypothetical protein
MVELGCCLRSWWTVREPHADGPQGGFQPIVPHVRRVFIMFLST